MQVKQKSVHCPHYADEDTEAYGVQSQGFYPDVVSSEARALTAGPLDPSGASSADWRMATPMGSLTPEGASLPSSLWMPQDPQAQLWGQALRSFSFPAPLGPWRRGQARQQACQPSPSWG